MDRFAKSLTTALIALMGFTLCACEKRSSQLPGPPLYRTPPPIVPSSNDTPPAEENPLEPAGCESVALPAYPAFVSIQTVFPDPQELLTTQDTASALARLKAIASPTQEYHAELLRLIDGAASIDKDHLVLLARAMYFTAADADRIEKDLAETAGKSDAESCLRRMNANRDHQVLVAYSSFSDTLLSSGARKLSSLTWDQAEELLNEVLPTEGGSPIFFAVFAHLDNVSEDALMNLVELASRKRAFNAAGEFALNWFRGFSDRDMSALVSLADKLAERAKDVLLLGALSDFRFFTLDEVISVATAGFEQRGVIAGRAFARIDVFSGERVQQVANKLDDQSRGDFLAIAIRQYRTIASEELKQLLSLTSYRRGEIALLGAEKLEDITVDNIASVTAVLSGSSRDEYLGKTAGRIDSLTTSQLLTLVKAAHKSGEEVAESLSGKVTDFGLKTIEGVAAALKGDAKDEWLRFALPRLERVTADQTLRLMKLAYVSGFAVAQNLLPKITDLTFENVIRINRELHGSERDKWIGSTLPSLAVLTSAQLSQLIDSVYSTRIQVALAGLDRLTDFTAATVALISAKLYGAERASWLQATMPRLEKVTTLEAIEILKTVSSNKAAFASELAARISDLTVANAVLVAANLKAEEKDAFLLKAVDLATDLTPSSLESLAKAGFNAGEEIRAKGEIRLGLSAMS